MRGRGGGASPESHAVTAALKESDRIPSSSADHVAGFAGHSLLHIPAPGPVAAEGDGADGHDEDDDHVVVQHGLVGGVERCPHRSAETLSQRARQSSRLGLLSPVPLPVPES